MDLINQTPLAAQLLVSDAGVAPDGARVRRGILVAKATFEVSPTGQLNLAAEDAAPILQAEEKTDFGITPRDFVMRNDDTLDIVVLGAAYAPHGRPAPETVVSLRIGSLQRSLVVVGDRYWIGSGPDARISEPSAFVRMPITWDRAFGGRAEVALDRESVFAFDAPNNKYGRGLDSTSVLEQVAHHWGAPPDYPHLTDPTRLLPNLEHPQQRIQAWSDEPEPYCWAPMPLDLGLRIVPTVRKVRAEQGSQRGGNRSQEPRHFAHPDWRIDVPEAGAEVSCRGCRPDGVWHFKWPNLHVSVDYAVGQRRGNRILKPFMAVLLPEESRMTLSFHHWFRFTSPDESEERSFRLRTNN